MVDIDRRTFVRSSGAGLLVMLGAAPNALAASGKSEFGSNHVVSVTAITKVFADGQKLVAVAVEYDATIKGAHLTKVTFQVANRTVVGVHTAASPSAGRSKTGRYVIVELLAGRPGGAALRADSQQRTGRTGRTRPGRTRRTRPGRTRSRSEHTRQQDPARQRVDRSGRAGCHHRRGRVRRRRHRVAHPPSHQRDRRRVQAVLVHRRQDGPHAEVQPVHPEGISTATSPIRSCCSCTIAGPVNVGPTAPLVQGLGVVCGECGHQAKHECFAGSQIPEIVIDDNYQPSTYFDATVNLVHWLTEEYSIDRRRLHTTGQSMERCFRWVWTSASRALCIVLHRVRAGPVAGRPGQAAGKEADVGRRLPR